MRPGYVLADDLEPTTPPEPSAALLPTLDPTTMGWKERDWYLGPHAALLFDRTATPARPSGGTAGSSAAGASAATARSRFRLLEDVGTRRRRAAIEAEVARLAAWLGDVRFSPGFLPPFQRELAS